MCDETTSCDVGFHCLCWLDGATCCACGEENYALGFDDVDFDDDFDDEIIDDDPLDGLTILDDDIEWDDDGTDEDDE